MPESHSFNGPGAGTHITWSGRFKKNEVNFQPELFCGYNAYREAFSGGESQINEVMLAKLDNELKMMQAVNLVTSKFGVTMFQPLLSPQFIEYAKTVPMSEKILSSEDLYRKHIIRKLAAEVNVPELSCTKRKKALQYGSKIHKALLKTR